MESVKIALCFIMLFFTGILGQSLGKYMHGAKLSLTLILCRSLSCKLFALSLQMKPVASLLNLLVLAKSSLLKVWKTISNRRAIPMVPMLYISAMEKSVGAPQKMEYDQKPALSLSQVSIQNFKNELITRIFQLVKTEGKCQNNNFYLLFDMLTLFICRKW